MTEVEVIGTGVDFIRTGIRAMEPTIEDIIKSALKEIQILAYVFTPSALPILELLESAATKGVKITIIVNDIDAQKPVIVKKFREMCNMHPNIMIANFLDERKRQLHAKVIVADRAKALVGSANFTWGGMFTNYEVGVRVEGESAWKLAALVDSLIYKQGQTTKLE